jgi:hypothetical protein
MLGDLVLLIYIYLFLMLDTLPSLWTQKEI